MNLFRFSAALLAVVCITSCNEKMMTEVPEGAGYITVTSQIGSQTKVGYETKTLPVEFIMDINQGNASFNYEKLKMTKEAAATSNTYTADREDLKWVSSDHKGALVKAMTIPSEVASIGDDNIVNINLLSDQRTPENFIKNDVLGARNSEGGGITIKGDAINVSFQHLMSKLHVIYETASPDIKVSAITLKNICLGGAYSYADVKYVGSDDARGNIKMYINTAAPDYTIFAAEAIFFPFEGKPTIDVTTNAGTKSCDIVGQNTKFEPGKRYVLRIKIDANGNVAKSNITTVNDWVKNVPGGKILWIGTSIPAGGGTVFSYPQMVANATGLEVINNAVGGSKVLSDPLGPTFAENLTKEQWDSYSEPAAPYSYHLATGGLVQSFDDIDRLYKGPLQNVKSSDDSSVDEVWVTKHINKLKELSYQSLISPYINGSLDNCKTVVIDHGFNDIVGLNDINAIGFEAGGFWLGEGNEDVWAKAFLSNLTAENYETAYKSVIQSSSNLTEEGSYLMSIEKLVDVIRGVDSNIRIIIGNYFAYDSPWGRANWWAGGFSQYNFAGTLCHYNEAAARIFGLDIVNVYDHIGEISDWYAFCPDGVHPSSDATGQSNRRIADVYLQELKQIFSTTATKSSSNSYDYGWEDVEIL